MSIESLRQRIRSREQKTIEQKIDMIRQIFVSELEVLFKEQDFLARKDDFQKLDDLKNGLKIKPYRILIDKVARIANENGIYTLEDLHKVYDALFEDWEAVTNTYGL